MSFYVYHQIEWNVYRITKLEVQIQEKNEAIKTDVKEVARQVRQIDWQSSKTESALDALKSDTSFLKQALEHFRVSPVQQGKIRLWTLLLFKLHKKKLLYFYLINKLHKREDNN